MACFQVVQSQKITFIFLPLTVLHPMELVTQHVEWRRVNFPKRYNHLKIPGQLAEILFPTVLAIYTSIGIRNRTAHDELGLFMSSALKNVYGQKSATAINPATAS